MSYWSYSGAMPTTAATAKIATGTATKTLLQVATPSTIRIAATAWGISGDASAAGVPGVCELIQTDVAATVTAHVAAGVQPYNDPGLPASQVVLGTTATGYNATAEGTITATRTADVQQIAPTNQYTFVWPLAREFKVAVSRFLRARVTFAATVNAIVWIMWEEAP